MGGQLRIVTTSSNRTSVVGTSSECIENNITRSYCYFHRVSSTFCYVLFARKSLSDNNKGTRRNAHFPSQLVNYHARDSNCCCFAHAPCLCDDASKTQRRHRAVRRNAACESIQRTDSLNIVVLTMDFT